MVSVDVFFWWGWTPGTCDAIVNVETFEFSYMQREIMILMFRAWKSLFLGVMMSKRGAVWRNPSSNLVL